MLTDKTIDYNRPDILLINIETKTALIIDIGVPLTHNIMKTEMEKQRKYEELALQLKHFWKLNEVTIHPRAVSAEGVVYKKTVQVHRGTCHIINIVRISQKVILLQICHIVRKFLN